MDIRLATLNDIDGVSALHAKYHVQSIRPEDKADGFVTTAITREQLAELIEAERGLSVAVDNGTVVAYAMAASWKYWSSWPLFACMIDKLETYSFAGQKLSTANSYQYGPVCVDKSLRGSSLFPDIFAFSLRSMASRYPIAATFINHINSRSFAAHTKKVHMTHLGDFVFNNNNYYWLACATNMFETH